MLPQHVSHANGGKNVKIVKPIIMKQYPKEKIPQLGMLLKSRSIYYVLPNLS